MLFGARLDYFMQTMAEYLMVVIKSIKFCLEHLVMRKTSVKQRRMENISMDTFMGSKVHLASREVIENIEMVMQRTVLSGKLKTFKLFLGLQDEWRGLEDVNTFVYNPSLVLGYKYHPPILNKRLFVELFAGAGYSYDDPKDGDVKLKFWMMMMTLLLQKRLEVTSLVQILMFI